MTGPGVAPGIEVVEIGGHTPGQLAVIVGTARGETVIASDALHDYEEMAQDRPFAHVTDVPATYAGFAWLREQAAAGRFPHIIRGDYLEGGLTSALMTKDIVLYADCLRELGAPSLLASGPLAAFGLASSLGYADQISNKVVDAIGDLAGGVRLYDPESDDTKAGD